MAEAPILDVQGLVAGYEGRAVLRGIDLVLPVGGSACIIGANGAGKTTLLRCLAGLLPAQAGSVRLHGTPITRSRAAARVAAGLALVPEGRRVFAPLTVRENLEVGAYRRLWPRRQPGVARDFEAVLALFPKLRERLSQRAGSLSGGEQQMLAIGRALMSAPRVLLLDEPSVGLAPLVLREIAAALRQLAAAGLTLLLTEQNARFALEMTEQGHVLADGGIVLSATSAALLVDPFVRAAYLGSAD